MVIDTSALMAMLNDEPEAESLEQAVEDDPVRLMSAATLVEVSIVMEAAVSGEPLLFKGDDFARTDVRAV